MGKGFTLVGCEIELIAGQCLKIPVHAEAVSGVDFEGKTPRLVPSVERNYSSLQGSGRRLGSVVYVKLLKHVAYMQLNRYFRDVQRACNFLVPESLDYQS